MASVTVIIPAYNSAAFLEETVASALNQSDPPERVIIVDDSSPDDSYQVACDLAAADPRVEAVQRPNGGACAARNTGLGLASTDFVLFLDADDRLLPDAITLQLAEFEKHPKATMVFGSNYKMSADGTRTAENPVPEQNVSVEDLAMYVTPCPSQCLYRRSSVAQIGGFDETLRPGDEIDLNLRLARIGEIRSHPAMVMEYRSHPGQGTRNVYKIAREHLRALDLNLGPGSPTPDPALLRRARHKWLARYGYRQHMAALGALRHGRYSEVVPAFQLALARAWARLMGTSWSPGQ